MSVAYCTLNLSISDSCTVLDLLGLYNTKYCLTLLCMILADEEKILHSVMSVYIKQLFIYICLVDSFSTAPMQNSQLYDSWDIITSPLPFFQKGKFNDQQALDSGHLPSIAI